MMSDHLYYYDSKKAYEKDPNDTLGRINLVAYYVSRTDPDTNEFCVHAYPKVRPFVGSPPPPPPLSPSAPSLLFLPPPPPLAFPQQSLTCRAGSKDEMEEWIAALMKPLRDLASVAGEGGGGGGGGGVDIAAGGGSRSGGRKKKSG